MINYSSLVFPLDESELERDLDLLFFAPFVLAIIITSKL
jgi:hypothetical protein